MCASCDAWVDDYRQRNPDSTKRFERWLRFRNVPRDSRGRFVKKTR